MSGRKETVLDLAKFVDKGVQVKLTGGRQVVGTLKGYDQLLNLVLDEAVEHLRDADDPLKTTDQKRSLGLIVCVHLSYIYKLVNVPSDQLREPSLSTNKFLTNNSICYSHSPKMLHHPCQMFQNYTIFEGSDMHGIFEESKQLRLLLWLGL